MTQHKYSFSQLFSNINPVIKNILESVLHSKEIDSTVFDSETHYRIYRNVIKKEISRIIISENYIILKPKTTSTYYIIGINNETNRLFVRGIPGLLLFENSKVMMINDILIEITNDREVRKELGYDKEIEELQIENVVTPIRVRVQGDLVLTITNVNCERIYWERLKRNILQLLQSVCTEWFMEKLREILEDQGLNIRINQSTIFDIVEWELRIPVLKCSIDFLYKFSKLLKKMIVTRGLLSEIEKEFSTKILTVEIKQTENKKPVIIIVTTKGEIKIYLDFTTTWSRSIILSLAINEELLKTKVNEILKELNINYRERNIKIGRHLIKFKSLPNTITLHLKMFDRERIYFINDLPLIVKGKIKILHPEHKTIEISFPIPTEIIINTITVSNGFVMLYNYLKLKELFKNM